MMTIILDFAKTKLTLWWLFIQFAWYFFDVCECQTNGDIRLVGGLVPLEGRVEVYYDGQWGTVCDDFWDDEDATVVCRQLGYYNNGTAFLQSAFGEGNGPIWMDNVQCDGTEYELQNCDYHGWGIHNCDHTEDASVACNPGDGEIRLVGGSSSTEGRVEVFHNGRWGWVCGISWDRRNADVVCRQLGFNASVVHYWSSSFFGEGNGPHWLDGVACTGNEDTLQNCTHRGWGEETNCPSSYVAGVRCNLGDKNRESSRYIRLAGGSTPNEGRVEVFHEPSRSWSTVCNDGWDDKDAVVVCRQLGFNSGGTAISHSTFGEGTGPINWLGIDCTGEEERLTDCRNAEWRGVSYCNPVATPCCDHTEDAGVRCNDVRLAYGEGSLEGRLEVFHDGEWGTVCDDSWSDTDAGVVCRQLGFGPRGTAIRRSFFGSTTRIRLHDIVCTGTETSLLDCDNSGWSDEKCDSSLDVGVSCIEEQQDFHLLLVITSSAMCALLLVVLAILVCLAIWIRRMKVSFKSNFNGCPSSIEMHPKDTDSRATRHGDREEYSQETRYYNPPQERGVVYENDSFRGSA